MTFEATTNKGDNKMSRHEREWCWKCEATVEVWKRHGTIICENCNTPLFDKDDY